MTNAQFLGLAVFLAGFANLYTLVTRFDRWRERLGAADNAPAARAAVLVYALGFVALPMAFGLALIYVLYW